MESTPAVADGVVYVGSIEHHAAHGALFAIDAGSGVERWRFSTIGEVRSSPAVADGVVYIGSGGAHDAEDEQEPDRGSLYAVDAATGAERWRFAAGGAIDSSPAIVDGVVYVGSGDGSLLAIEAATGVELWRFQTDGEVGSSPAVVDGVVYVGSTDGFIYAVGGSGA
jgi:outer membrane protein assembly factor BamB